MRIGDLRHRITIAARAATTDVGPGKTVAWTTIVATVWACVRLASTRELLQAQAMTSEVTTTVTIRYRTDITPAHRITWGSKTLQIHSVTDPDGQRNWLQLACGEVA